MNENTLSLLKELTRRVSHLERLENTPAAVIIGDATAELNQIILFPTNTDDPAFYPKSTAGLTSALSDAASAACILWLPPGTYGDATDNWSIPASCGITSLGDGAIIRGTTTFASGSSALGVTFQNSQSSGSDITAVIGPASGTAILNDCHLTCTNSGAGDARALVGDVGNVDLWTCWLEATADSGDGFAIYQTGAGQVTHRYSKFSAISGGVDSPPFGGVGVGAETFNSTTTGATALSLWNGSSNDSPPADWMDADFDDSGWDAAIHAQNFFMNPVWYGQALWSSELPVNNAEECLLRCDFTLSAGGSSATLYLQTDDRYVNIYVNGELVLAGVGGGTEPQEYAISAAFQSGANVLAIHGRNIYASYAWVAFRLVVQESYGDIRGYGSQIDHEDGITAMVSELGDRSAWDALNYATRHTNDIDASAIAIHHSLGTGASQAAAGDHAHAGLGDMTKVVYDTDDDGIVDNSEKLTTSEVEEYSSGDAKCLNVRSLANNAFTRLLVQPHGVAASGDTAIHLYYSRTGEGGTYELFLGIGANHGANQYLIASGDAGGAGQHLPILFIMEEGVTQYPVLRMLADQSMEMWKHLDIHEISAPGNPAADVARLYAKDSSGTTKLYYKRSDGTEIELGAVAALANHDHSGDAGDGGTFDAANLTSGAATDGYVLSADGSGGAAWEAGNDANAIHDNVAGEISAITEKTTPVTGDLIVIEDSASGNAKKRVQLGNLPGLGKYRQFTYVVTSGDFSFVIDGDGNPVMALQELE